MENYKAQHAEVVPDAKDKNAMVQIEKCFATETLNKIHKKRVRGPNLRKKTTQLKPKKALKPRASGGAKRKRKKKATSIEELFADMGEKPKKKRKLNKKVPKREKRTLEQLLGMEDAYMWKTWTWIWIWMKSLRRSASLPRRELPRNPYQRNPNPRNASCRYHRKKSQDRKNVRHWQMLKSPATMIYR